jgi:Xaa-Pro aminopeptidase
MAAAKQTTSNTSARLALLRKELKRQKLDAFLVPRQDEHQGEYVGAYAERLKWITGFSGSWGVAVVGMKNAAIFVDGRYTVQVHKEVDGKNFSFHHLVNEPPHLWLAKTFKKGARIGYDPTLTAIGNARELQAACENAKLKLVPVTKNCVDAVWKDQPARPSTAVADHPLTFSGRSVADKLKDIAKDLTSRKIDAVVLSDPASTCWAFNIRASDIPFTPMPLGFGILKAKGKAELFIDPQRFDKALLKSLSRHVNIAKPSKLAASLNALGKQKARVGLDTTLSPDHFRLALTNAGAKPVDLQDPCTFPRACKNKTEQKGARNAHVRDGVAMANYLCWLSGAAPSGTITEGAAAHMLETFRKRDKSCVDLSFGSISAAGPDAALPHYHANGEGRLLKRNEIYLIDSGGQYREGTTDITRTVIIGQPTDEMKDRFTRVLKGMIAISEIRFPKGTTGAHIDVLAREALWKVGLDFDHGTGHGVGSFLSVHEGPARISKAGHVALRPGMLLSNEPGFYKPGHFGIRIENLLFVTSPSKIKGGDREMMGFETINWCPVDRHLIDTSLLTRAELQWLDHYHARVFALIEKRVLPETRAWLEKACAPLPHLT